MLISDVRDEIFNEGFDAGYDKAEHEKEIEIDELKKSISDSIKHVYYALDDVKEELE